MADLGEAAIYVSCLKLTGTRGAWYSGALPAGWLVSSYEADLGIAALRHLLPPALHPTTRV